MISRHRFKAAGYAAVLHLLISLAVASLAALLVFGAWFPFPYSQLSGGLELFLLVVGVDVVCGPLLTLVLFNPQKPKSELWRDMGLVILIQLTALAYGLFTAWQARPLYLVHEVDRFRVISLQDYQGVDLTTEFAKLPTELKRGPFSAPITVGIRNPLDSQERHHVMVESVLGGRDYSQRPEFYIPYDANYTSTVMKRVKPLTQFLIKYPETARDANEVLMKFRLKESDVFVLPVVHREDWVAMLSVNGEIFGFLPGDGFLVSE